MERLSHPPLGLRSRSEHTLYDEKMALVSVEHGQAPASEVSSSSHKSKRSLLSRIASKLTCTSVEVVVDSSVVDLEKAGKTAGVDAQTGKLLDGYNHDVDKLRDVEYPDLKERAYLDNAGTQLPARSLLTAFTNDLSTTLYGNPHTHSLPARNSAARITAIRKRALEFFHADPEEFDLVFVANATAAIKLVGEALRDYCEASGARLRYMYHKDAHNSLVGTREFAGAENTRVFRDEADVDEWLNTPSSTSSNGSNEITLFAYPGQSNMTGERHPLHRLDSAKKLPNTYTLLDAAALATTKQLELSDWAPDFTALSFYKIFGFPDLGALIVRRSAAHVLTQKKYFAGGTVDGVTVFGTLPGMIRRESIHEQLEEGTLPFHSIIALDHALNTHARLFGSMARISGHVAALTRYCAMQLHSLTYPGTSRKLCRIYAPSSLFSHDPSRHGGTIAFNLSTRTGQPIGYRSVERAADGAGVFVRSGAMCNPGGMATHLGWSDGELERVFEAGFRCSRPIEVWEGKWTGVVRVSFGAASCRRDVDKLVAFLRREYLFREMGVPG